MATGMARGARARGKAIAFGDGRRIIWDQNSEIVFRGNPNIAPPGSEGRAANIEWVPYYKGHRIYNYHDRTKDRWVWNMEFRPTPGEMFFTDEEAERGRRYGNGFVLIEPAVERWKVSAQNKDWGRVRYQTVADRLLRAGYGVMQFSYSRMPLPGVRQLAAADFRDALAIASQASLYIGPEGGLHHGAAAVGLPAVVLFGGFIPPQVTGYDTHTNLTGGAEACGSLKPCAHCRAAMNAISVEEVVSAAIERMPA